MKSWHEQYQEQLQRAEAAERDLAAAVANLEAEKLSHRNADSAWQQAYEKLEQEWINLKQDSINTLVRETIFRSAIVAMRDTYDRDLVDRVNHIYAIAANALATPAPAAEALWEVFGAAAAWHQNKAGPRLHDAITAALALPELAGLVEH